MKAMIVTMNGSKIYDVKDLGNHYTITGYTEDLTAERNRGAWVHRAELDNQPKLENLCGPMWDGNMLRYEDWKVYDLLSR